LRLSRKFYQYIERFSSDNLYYSQLDKSFICGQGRFVLFIPVAGKEGKCRRDGGTGIYLTYLAE